jgi:glycosyltransferase involved in cell wall biosynthesis
VDNIPSEPPIIPAINSDNQRPMWSVMIPVFNCAPFLKTAIRSVLMQDIGENQMQIEVIDDCSTDADVSQIVEELGKGRVCYFKQSRNVGSLRNFETCIKRAKGLYVHLLHGDDCVKFGFYDQLGSLFQQFPNAGAACCALDLINVKGQTFFSSEKEAEVPGILTNWLYKLAERPRLQFVCVAVKREVYEKLGGFFLGTFGEDWEMWSRIAKHYETAYTPEVLAQYRIHKHSISGRGANDGSNLKSLRIVINKITSYLPQHDQKKFNKKATKYCANIAIKQIADQYQKEKDSELFAKQIRELLKFFKSSKFMFKILILKFFAKLPEKWFNRFLNKVF